MVLHIVFARVGIHEIVDLVTKVAVSFESFCSMKYLEEQKLEYAGLVYRKNISRISRQD